MNIALVAHDARKKELLEWVKYNLETLSKHSLCATGTTGRLVEELFKKEGYEDFEVKRYHSGPLCGDAEIGAAIGNGEVDFLVFFCDSLVMQAHQPDIQGLSRLASLYNIPFATNRTTADMLISSPLFDNKEYKRIIPSCIEQYVNRQI